jgi:methionyl-tRNA synthetase
VPSLDPRLQAAFVTGSDEHGEKIATTATDNGKEPQEFVDGIVDEVNLPGP